MARDHSNRFKFDSSTFFLTYSQSDLTWQQIIDHLKTLCDIKWARVCQEQHQDGGRHQHVVGQFVRRFQTSNSTAFDVAGKHPDVQPVRSVKRALEYVSKDGEFTDIGTVPRGKDSDVNWMDAAATMDKGEYYSYALQQGLPIGYANVFWDLGRKHSCEIGPSYEANIEYECQALRDKELPAGTTVVIGPSGVGKTSWAKRVCTKPALWVRHIDVLRSFRPRYHKSIIFDDMSFTHLPRESQIHLVDQTDEAHIHCRYGVAVIPAGTEKIFTANYTPFLDDPAINRRVNHIYL